jgi:flagellar biosynthesis GTPase FlhF
MEPLKSPVKTGLSIANGYVAEKGIDEKKFSSEVEAIGEEQLGIIDMSFQFEDYVENDKENVESGSYISTTETREEDSFERKTVEEMDDLKDKILPETTIIIASAEEVENEEETEETEDCVNESLEIIREMSQILNTKLSKESLRMCVELIEEGADYAALAQIIKKWRLKKAPKPVRKLGHFFDPLEDPGKKKKEWVW